MGLPCVTVTSLILPFPQVPSSTKTEVPFLMSKGSFLTTTWALQVPLAATNNIIASRAMSDFMSNALDVRVAKSGITMSKTGCPWLNGGPPDAERKFWCAEEGPLFHYHCLRLRLSA
jgi:hypothetical protein